MNKNMKPVIAVAGVSLAFSVAFTGLVSCNKNPGEGEETTTLPSIYDTTDPVVNGTTAQTPDGTSKEPESSAQELEYTDVDDTVYITVETVYLRSAPVLAENTIVGYGKMGESYQRKKFNEKWSVILLNGEEVYVSSDCVSTEKPGSIDLKFNAIDKTVYVTADELNLRDLPSADNSSVKAVAVKDQALVAIGISEDGKWYKINYKNAEGAESILYASATYLTDVVIGADFTAINKTVRVTAETLNIRKAPTTDGEVVGIVAKDTLVTVIGISPDGSWYKVKYTPSKGTEGTYYMSASSKYVADVEGSTSTTEAQPAETSEPTGTESSSGK